MSVGGGCREGDIASSVPTDSPSHGYTQHITAGPLCLRSEAPLSTATPVLAGAGEVLRAE